MKDKEKVLLISLWAVLIFYTILKLLGFMPVDFSTNNEKLIAFCNSCNFGWKYCLVCLFTYTTSTYIYFMIVLNKKKLDILTLILIIIVDIIKLAFEKYKLFLLFFELIFLVIYPMINKKKFYFRPIICYALAFAFQFLSLITIGSKIEIVQNNILIVTLWSLDYYLYLLINFMYFNKYGKEV